MACPASSRKKVAHDSNLSPSDSGTRLSLLHHAVDVPGAPEPRVLQIPLPPVQPSVTEPKGKAKEVDLANPSDRTERGPQGGDPPVVLTIRRAVRSGGKMTLTQGAGWVSIGSWALHPSDHWLRWG